MTVNRGKTGIYRFTNKLTGHQYIGQAVDLSTRVSRYWQPKVRANSGQSIPIELNRYGTDTVFELEVLQYCSADQLDELEQYYFDKFQPYYNHSELATSTKGVKHTEHSKALIRANRLGQTHSVETRASMSESRIGALNNFYGRTHTAENKLLMSKVASSRNKDHNEGYKVTVRNLITGAFETYKSLRAAKPFVNNALAHTIRNIFNNKVIITPAGPCHVKVDMTKISANNKTNSIEPIPITASGYRGGIPIVLIMDNNTLPIDKLIFVSISEAANFLDTTNNVIYEHINKRYTTTTGCIPGTYYIRYAYNLVD